MFWYSSLLPLKLVCLQSTACNSWLFIKSWLHEKLITQAVYLNFQAFRLNTFLFQKMKFLLAIYASITSSLVVERYRSRSSDLLGSISRRKRDLSGYNRRINTNFSHERQRGSRMGTGSFKYRHSIFLGIKLTFHSSGIFWKRTRRTKLTGFASGRISNKLLVISYY